MRYLKKKNNIYLFYFKQVYIFMLKNNFDKLIFDYNFYKIINEKNYG